MRRIKKLSALKGIAIFITVSLFFAGVATLMAAGEKMQKGYLGVSIEKLSQNDKEEFDVSFGVLVANVSKGEPAEKAGIKKNDVILYFNGEKIRRPENLIDAVRETKPGTKAKVKLVRDGKQKEVTVIVGELKPQFSWHSSKDGKDFTFYTGHGGGYLGVQLHELNGDLAGYFGVKENEGVLLLKVEEDSPAEKAGLKAGDVIVELDGKKITDSGKVSKVVSAYEKGDEIEVKIVRHKKEQKIKVELGERSGFRSFDILKGPGIMRKFSAPGVGAIPWEEGHQRIILRHHKEAKDQIKKKIEEAKKKDEIEHI
jgi:serine protease Do